MPVEDCHLACPLLSQNTRISLTWRAGSEAHNWEEVAKKVGAIRQRHQGPGISHRLYLPDTDWHLRPSVNHCLALLSDMQENLNAVQTELLKLEQTVHDIHLELQYIRRKEERVRQS